MVSEVNDGKNSLSDLLKDDVYHHIPKFQRDYNWGEKQASDLWNDLVQYIDGLKEDNKSKYLFGQIIVYKYEPENKKNNGSNDDNESAEEDEMKFYVIDGQQRLTTVILFITAVRDIIDCIWSDKNDDYETYVNKISYVQKYIRDFGSNKLRLEISSDHGKLISDMILNHVDVNAIDIGENAAKSNVRTVYNFFIKKLCESCKIPSNLTIAEMKEKLENYHDYANTVELYLKKLLSFKVYYIIATNLRDAYRIFERTNSRGIKLTQVDLIKNYIFSTCYSTDKDLDKDKFKIENQWNNIISVFKTGNNGDNSEQMFRYYHMSKYGHIKLEDLYDKLTSKLDNSSKIISFLDDLEKSLKIYRTVYGSLQYFETYTRNNKTLKAFNYVNFQMFYPLLLSAFLKVENDVEKKKRQKEYILDSLINTIETFYVRNILVGNHTTNEYEKEFAEYAKSISTSDDYESELNNVMGYIIGYLDSSEMFIDHVKTRNNWKNPQVRFIQSEYYNKVVGIMTVELGSLDLDHIMPRLDNYEEFKKYWPDITLERKKETQYMIGNTILFEKSKNRSKKAFGFDEKLGEYKKKTIVDIDEGYVLSQDSWGPEYIIDRTEKLAKSFDKAWPKDENLALYREELEDEED